VAPCERASGLEAHQVRERPRLDSIHIHREEPATDLGGDHAQQHEHTRRGDGIVSDPKARAAQRQVACIGEHHARPCMKSRKREVELPKKPQYTRKTKTPKTAASRNSREADAKPSGSLHTWTKDRISTPVSGPVPR